MLSWMARRISRTRSNVSCDDSAVTSFKRRPTTKQTAWWIMWIAVALKCQPRARRDVLTKPFAVAWSPSQSHWNRHRQWRTTKRRSERRIISSSSAAQLITTGCLPQYSRASFSKRLVEEKIGSSSSLCLCSSTSASSSQQEDNVTTTTSN